MRFMSGECVLAHQIRSPKFNQVFNSLLFRDTYGWRVAAVGGFGAFQYQPAQKFDSSTQLQLCTSPPIEAIRG